MEPNNDQIFTEMETDAIGEIMNISLGSSATSVSTMLDRPVNITTPRVKVMLAKDFEFENFEPAIGVEIQYVSGLDGKNIMIMKESDVKVIVGLLLQTDYNDPDNPFVMDEMSVGAICEVMNQMMGASSTALSQFLNRPINISPPNSFAIDNSDQFKSKYFDSDGPMVAVYFNLMIDDLVNSEFISIMSVDLAKELVSMFGFGGDGGDDMMMEEPEPQAAAPAPAAAPAAQPMPAAAPVMDPAAAGMPPQQPGYPAGQPMAPYGYPQQPMAYPMPPMGYAPPPQNYTVSQAPLRNFDTPDVKLTGDQSSNLNMILSVPLEITVEIGRTTKKIKDILDFTAGTIVELDKQAGSHVDVYVNGKPIAQGDVVVVDDFYGVRITDVCSNSEIINSL